MYYQGEHTGDKRLNLLAQHREKAKAQLKTVKENLKVVDKQIDAYQKKLSLIELA